MPINVNRSAVAIQAQGGIKSAGRMLGDVSYKFATGNKYAKPSENLFATVEASMGSARLSYIESAMSSLTRLRSILSTRNGALTTMRDGVQQLSKVALEAAGTLSAEDRNASVNVFNQLFSRTANVAKTADYAGIKLLDGSFGANADVNALTKAVAMGVANVTVAANATAAVIATSTVINTANIALFKAMGNASGAAANAGGVAAAANGAAGGNADLVQLTAVGAVNTVMAASIRAVYGSDDGGDIGAIYVPSRFTALQSFKNLANGVGIAAFAANNCQTYAAGAGLAAPNAAAVAAYADPMQKRVIDAAIQGALDASQVPGAGAGDVVAAALTASKAVVDSLAGNNVDSTLFIAGTDVSQTLTVYLKDMSLVGLLGGTTLDISTMGNANTAATLLSTAVTSLNSEIALTAAYDNSVDSLMNQMQVSQENLAASVEELSAIDIADTRQELDTALGVYTACIAAMSADQTSRKLLEQLLRL